MKNSLKTLLVLTLLAVAGLANAQNSANDNGAANAVVICPITIHNTTNLQFGTITNSASGGSVTVPPIGSAVYSGVVATTGSHAGATPHSANFNDGGEGSYSYSITPTIITNFSGGPAILSNLTVSVGTGGAGGTGPSAYFPCDPNNPQDVNGGPNGDGDAYSGDTADDVCGCVTDHICVGGKLTLTSAAGGTYAAVINVAIAYN
jgi:hypothetical protein